MFFSLRGDVPQMNEDAGTKLPGAIHPCRKDLSLCEDATNFAHKPTALFNLQRSIKDSRKTRENAETAMNATTRSRIIRDFGLSDLESAWTSAGLVWDPFRQTPSDIPHPEGAGTCKDRLIDLKQFPSPPGYSSTPNPVGHSKRLQQRDAFNIVSYGALALDCALRFRLSDPRHTFGIKKDTFEKLKLAYPEEIKNHEHCLNLLIETWTAVAESNFCVLARSMDEEAYSELHDNVLAGRQAMLKMFGPLTDELDKLPNMHLALHLADDARLFSNCLNSSVALDEILHKAPKTLVPHTNFKDIDVAFLEDDNLLQTMRSVLARGTTEDCPRISRIYTALQHGTPKLFDGYYFGHHVVNVGALDDHSGKVGNLSLEQVDKTS
ncbi:hypothetical protein BT69DRAFT_1345104 [Atractiella rhizophila]|nr:hypothetical protein BT69DRAFT_1345104 [Atractiella rhizophila]